MRTRIIAEGDVGQRRARPVASATASVSVNGDLGTEEQVIRCLRGGLTRSARSAWLRVRVGVCRSWLRCSSS